MSQVDLINEFYREFDLGVETDLFGYFFLCDTLRGNISPCFPKIEDLEDWILKHLKDLKGDLT